MPLYVTHDHSGDLLDVGIYLQPYSNVGYKGLYGEAPDYLDVLDWGTTVNKGLMANMDPIATSTTSDLQFKSGTAPVGDSLANKIPLATAAVLGATSTVAGHFPVGGTAHVTMKVSVPATETDAGNRHISLWLAYNL